MKTRIILFSVLFMSSAVVNAQTIMNIYQNNGTVVQIPLNSIDSITYSVLNPNNLATLTTLLITNLTTLQLLQVVTLPMMVEPPLHKGV